MCTAVTPRFLSWSSLLLLLLLLSLCAQFQLATCASGTSEMMVVDLSSSTFDDKVMKSDAPWIVAFVAPWCGHCQRLHPEYEKAAESLGGVVNVGRVNCDDEQQLAVRFGIKGFPTIKVFGYGKAAKNEPEDYQGARAAKPIVDHALRLFNAIPDPVSTISTVGAADAFLANDASGTTTTAKALLFSSRSANPSLWKSIAVEFADRKMSFAFVRDTHTDVAQKFGVEKFPQVVVVPAGAAAAAAAAAGGSQEPVGKVLYSGALKKADLVSFLSAHLPQRGSQSSSSGSGSGSGSGEEGGQEGPSQVFSAKVPPVFVYEPVELSNQKQLDEHCGGTVCVIGVVTSDEDKKLLTDMTASFAKQLRIVFVREDKHPLFVNAFKRTTTTTSEEGGASQGGVDLIVLRAARRRYARVGNVGMGNAPHILESILYGGLKFSTLSSVPQLTGIREDL